MNNSNKKPGHAWTFGAICPDCGAPNTQFCALCAADLFATGHGAVPVGPLKKRQFVAVCDSCIDRLKAGEWPPFRHDAHAQIKDRMRRLRMPGSK